MKLDKLEQRGEEWFVLSEEGEEREGPFESREMAAERLRQIEAAKAARGSKDHQDAVWSTAFINDLPDSSFLYVEPGGSKDGEGKTTPRSLRHFPVKGPDGAVDMPHLRAALSRIPQSDVPAAAKASSTAKAQRLLERERPDAEGDALGMARDSNSDAGSSQSPTTLSGVAYTVSPALAPGRRRQDTTVHRYDYLPLHTDRSRPDGIFMETTPEGFLKADARPSRIGVLEYRDADGNAWGELRTADEVFSEDSLRSFDLAVITNDHPEEFVSVDNVKSVDVGAVGNDARPDGRFVRVSMVVRDPDAIRAIKDGKRELSCGYTAQVIADSGEADGLAFSGRQTNIRINHVAIVDRGRAGSECAVLTRGDAYHLHTTDGVHVTTTNKKTGDAQQGPEHTDTALEEIRATFQSKIDTLEAALQEQRDGFSARVDERAKLLAIASRHGIAAEGKTDSEIQRAIAAKLVPSMAEKLEARKDDESYVRGCFGTALEIEARRDAEVTATNEVVFEALRGDGEGDVFEQALTAYANRGKA